MSLLGRNSKERKRLQKIQEKAEKKAEKKLKKKIKKEGIPDHLDIGVKILESYVDFTLLDPRATDKDIVELINIAAKNRYHAVVVPPVFVSFAKEYIQNKFEGKLDVVSVVGFPLGHTTTKAKIVEAKNLARAGADEIEVSLDISMVKMGNYSTLKSELSKVVRAAKHKTVGVVLETAYLDDAEIEKVVKICIKAKADYVMTSSGYAPIGATLENVERIVLFADNRISVKAAGGVKTRMDAESFVRIGASRVGTSRIL